jgi:hypothetical protein
VNENELHDRMRSLGSHPIDDATQAAHLRRIETVTRPEAVGGRRRFGVLAVAAAGIVGFLAGSTGLAMAGALPDPAQDVAHDVFGVVKVDVPAGKQDKRGPCVSEAAKIEDEAAKQAAKDACPKGGPDDEQPDPNGPNDPGDPSDGDQPGRSGEAPGKADKTPKDKANGTTKHDDDPCRGRPAWTGPMTQEEREDAKAANSREACIDDVDDGIDETDETDGG